MKKVVDDPRLIYKCCKMYYEDDLGQKEIADILGISRVSVSRMLRAGRESGIVQIQVVSPNHLTYSDLERRLEQMYGLKEAVVVDNSPLATSYDQQTAFGTAAINLLDTYLHDGDIVGVSMGMTLHTICRTTRPNPNPIHCAFVPVLGGISSVRSAAVDVHANQIAIGLAQLFGGQYFEFFSPVMFSSKEVLDVVMHERSMRRIVESYKRMNTVIMGIGTPNRPSSTMIRSGYIKQEEIDHFVEEGMVGDILMQFFDKNGSTEPFKAFNERVAGLPLHQLRDTVENRICAGSGAYKAGAICSAMRGGFVNILITDQECAQKLLELGEQS
ncbi:MAG: sugar-binding transcriptional regulator [Butyricicoccus sp.]|jgi:deoxyribonucleoside regulator